MQKYKAEIKRTRFRYYWRIIRVGQSAWVYSGFSLTVKGAERAIMKRCKKWSRELERDNNTKKYEVEA